MSSMGFRLSSDVILQECSVRESPAGDSSVLEGLGYGRGGSVW